MIQRRRAKQRQPERSELSETKEGETTENFLTAARLLTASGQPTYYPPRALFEFGIIRLASAAHGIPIKVAAEKYKLFMKLALHEKTNTKEIMSVKESAYLIQISLELHKL